MSTILALEAAAFLHYYVSVSLVGLPSRDFAISASKGLKGAPMELELACSLPGLELTLL